nr:restriction endonuclease subunit S [Arthrobacter silviterrae]
MRDICRFDSGGTPDRANSDFYGGTTPWISGADIAPDGRLSPRSQITELALTRSAARVVGPGTILLVTRTSVGKVAIAPYPVSFSQDITAITPSPEALDTSYLVEFLKSQQDYFTGNARGATIKGITRDVVRNLSIPLPRLPEQRRIAAILDKADRLRAQRREALAHLDALTQSIFNDMFVLNLNTFTEVHDLGNVCDFYAGSSLRGGESWTGQDHGFLQLKVSDMNRRGNEVQIRGAALWSGKPGAKSATLPAGSIIFPKRGASIATNKKRTVMRPAVLDPNLMGITPRASVDIYYLHHWFEKFDLTSLSSGSSVPQLNKKDLFPVQIPVPPLELQQTFARRVAGVERLKEQHRTQLAELDTLFESLQHRAFRGEL